MVNTKNAYPKDIADRDPAKFIDRFPEIAEHFAMVEDLISLRRAKGEAIKKADAGEWPDGPVAFFWRERSELIKSSMEGCSASEARVDRMLRVRNSQGRAKARR